MSENLLSHQVSAENIDVILQKITKRIISQSDKQDVSVSRQLEILTQLSEFDFGRFLLQNQGINGYWTHYMLTHPWFGKLTGKNNRGESFSEMEYFLLNELPLMLATQERFEIFIKENQTAVKNNATLACIPAGMLGELLYLNYSHVDNIELVGIDFDATTLQDAKLLADKKNLTHYTSLLQQDAWKLEQQNKFDLISSNGLNFYEASDDKVTSLYRIFYNALKPGGKLVTSFFTTQPEWDMTAINKENVLLQKIIFADVIQVRWQHCYRSTALTREQLQKAGFTQIDFIYDKAKLMPTVVAFK